MAKITIYAHTAENSDTPTEWWDRSVLVRDLVTAFTDHHLPSTWLQVLDDDDNTVAVSMKVEEWVWSEWNHNGHVDQQLSVTEIEKMIKRRFNDHYLIDRIELEPVR